MGWQLGCSEAQKTTPVSIQESSRFEASDTAPDPALPGAPACHSLIFIQYPHVLVCEEVQERNVADGLVNITHCNFFGNPGPKNKGC